MRMRGSEDLQGAHQIETAGNANIGQLKGQKSYAAVNYSMSKPTERATGGRQRPTSSKGSKSRLARRLWEWATDEMKYSGGEEGALRQEDLQV